MNKVVARDGEGNRYVICKRCGNVTFPRKECEVAVHLKRACKKCDHGRVVQEGHRRNRTAEERLRRAEELAERIGVTLPDA